MTLVQEIETSEYTPDDVIFPDRDLYSDEPPVGGNSFAYLAFTPV